jgi:hypothetical protein
VCRSGAIALVERREREELTDRYALRCGGCGTWRIVSADPVAAQDLERRLERDRRRMVRSLRRLEARERQASRAGEPAEAR